MILTKESFKQKQLAEMKGGLYEYYEYKEGNRLLVLRFYLTALAVDYYVGIDVEDSRNESYEANDNETAWRKALETANAMAKEYNFTGATE